MNISVNLNAEAIYQSLDAKDGTKDGNIEKSIWDSFADITGGNHINNYIGKRNAMKSINSYLKRASEETINRICEFLGWNNTTTDVQEEIQKSDNLLEQIAENPSMVVETTEGEYEDGYSWKQAKLADGRYVKVLYSEDGKVEVVKVSTDPREFEHYDGVYDGAEVIYADDGVYTGNYENIDEIAMDVASDDYDFSNYQMLAEKIFGVNTNAVTNDETGEDTEDDFIVKAHVLCRGNNDYVVLRNHETGEIRYYDDKRNELTPEEFKESCPNIYNQVELRKTEKTVVKGDNGYYVTQDKDGNYYYYNDEGFETFKTTFKEVCPTIYENIEIKKSEKTVVRGNNGYYVTQDKNKNYHYYDSSKTEISAEEFKKVCPTIYENIQKRK